jgi:hypothetical protein
MTRESTTGYVPSGSSLAASAAVLIENVKTLSSIDRLGVRSHDDSPAEHEIGRLEITHKSTMSAALSRSASWSQLQGSLAANLDQ